MSSEVKRYSVVLHVANDSPFRQTGDSCTRPIRTDVVLATDYAAIEAECERLRVQVSALQSDANSWQSGYDKGRDDGAKAAEGWKAQHARDSAELRRLCSERDALAAELAAIKRQELRADPVKAQLLEAADNAVDVFSDKCRRRLGEIEAVQQLAAAIAAARKEGGKV